MKHCILCLFVGVNFLVAAENESRPAEPAAPPRPPTYKPLMKEGAELTPMDIRGPDGLVYPNWTWAGVQGGIPDVSGGINLEERGAKTGADIAALIESAAAELNERGGGVIRIGPGTYYLNRPVFIRGANIVIRGAGMEKTKLIFRYAIPKGEAHFYGLKPGDSFENLYVVGNPEGIAKMTILGDSKPAVTLARTKDHWGNRFYLGATREKLLQQFGAGDHEFKGVIEYEDGTKAETTATLHVSDTVSPRTIYSQFAAVSFEGSGPSERRILLGGDGIRGADRLVLQDGHGLHKGDYIQLVAPPSERWNRLSGNVNTSFWALFRANQYQIKSVDGNVVTLNQPLRLEFPKVDGSYLQVIRPVTGCGVEDLTIEQTENLWIGGVQFAWSWNCWAKNVKVVKTGRHPVIFIDSKFGEVRGCVYDDALFKGDGGSAYGGFERAYDCLMENVETFNLRHAPIFNWACSGNVVRNSVFHGSDAHWHAGWCNENLFENCVIEATNLRGGMAAIGPKFFKLHGPQGPRNVVYNCDVQVLRAAGNDMGFLMQGMNEHWLVVYNRFVVKKGGGIVMQDHAFDHIVKGNVFCLESGKPYVINFLDDTCSGIELLDNLVYGDVQTLVSGPGQGCMENGNVIAPYQLAPRPTPPVPSIYEWQKEQAKRTTAR